MEHKLVYTLLLGFIASCSANPQIEDKSPDQRAIEDLDNAFHEHIRATALPRSVATAAGLKQPLERKVAGLQVLERSYSSFAKSAEPRVAAHALRRSGQLYLNVGCEIATMEIAIGSDGQLADKAQRALEQQSEPMLDRATQLFQRASKIERGGSHSEVASSLVTTMRSSASVERSCGATTAHWAAPGRPDTAVAAVDPEECLDDWRRRSKEKCRAAYETACTQDDAKGCNALGLLRYGADELEAALEAFDRACELGGGCLPTLSVSVEARRGEYERRCSDDDPTGCLQLGRLLDGPKPTLLSCTATSVPPADEAAKRCEAAEAAGCWARAGELLAEKPVDLPEMMTSVIGIGGLGMRGKPNETREEYKQRLRGLCENEKSVWSCSQLAEMQIEDGEDPEPTFRTACKINQGGCYELARYLLDQDDDAKIAEAVDLLTKQCDDHHASSCDAAAGLFAAGEKVPKSTACAAALSWRTCAPDRDWNCRDINRVFGHERKSK